MKHDNMRLSALDWCDLERGPLIHVPPAAPVALVRHLTDLRSRQAGELNRQLSAASQPPTAPVSDREATPSGDSPPASEGPGAGAGCDTQSTITDWYSPEQLVRVLDAVERLRGRLLSGGQAEVKPGPRGGRKGSWTLSGRAGRGATTQDVATTQPEVAAVAGGIIPSATSSEADERGPVLPAR